MAAVWQVGFGILQIDGFSDPPRSNLIRSRADIGPGKIRRRYTGKLRGMNGSRLWSVSEYNTFITWYQNDLEEGAVEFTMTDPIIGDTGTFRMMSYTPAAVSGNLVRVSFELERIS